MTKPFARMRQRVARAALALGVVFLPVIISAQSKDTRTFATLYSFKHPRRDGALPYGGVIADKSGNLYGTTWYGGASGAWGAVFKLDEARNETLVHSFHRNSNGYRPTTGLIMDGISNLYGTTDGDYSQFGTVFKLDASGKQTVLYRFSGGQDGGGPSGLVRDAAGNLYGTTFIGGANWDPGAVFKVDKKGKETVLYSFTGGLDGGYPYAGVIRDKDGNLYGTTSAGGRGGPSGGGTVFKVDGSGKQTVLHSFTDGTDGRLIWAGLVMDSEGNLYGAAVQGGDLACHAPYGCGTVFKLDSTGKLTVLHSFTGGTDGMSPQATLIRDSAGDLFGTTAGGGNDNCQPPYGCGTVFKLDKTGKETVLHRFTGGADGAFPSALFRDQQGNLYGTTSNGGDLSCVLDQQTPGCGTVFKLHP
jgi:uncharacterized repeat protein (TIGR03803 family)